MPDSELDRVLDEEFNKPTSEREGLGRYNYTQYDRPAPGIIGRRAVGEYGRVRDTIPKEELPVWANDRCLNFFSRFLEETFRNFQLTIRPPSHIAPPFTAKPIDTFPEGPVTIPAAGAMTTVVTFTVPRGRYRGEVWFGGQSAESAAAFFDLEWQIIVDGRPYDPFTGIFIQLWEMVPPTKFCAPIHLVGGQTIALQARSITNQHEVMGRLCGWFYQVRSETGDEIKSTLVD